MGFELPRVKLQYKFEGNPGEIKIFRVSARFELVLRARIIGSQLYLYV